MNSNELRTNIFTQLSKTTEGSNKFYNIYIKECPKGQTFEGDDNKVSTQNGFEVYSVFGKIDKTARKRHVGFFYSRIAAERSATRLKETKKQKGYSDNGAKTYVRKVVMDANAKKDLFFKPMPTVKIKMTKVQKGRFADLID